MYSRMLRDLDTRLYIEGMGGMYFNEDSWADLRPDWKPFDKEKAYYKIAEIAEKRNYWEKVRCGIIQRPKPSWIPEK